MLAPPPPAIVMPATPASPMDFMAQPCGGWNGNPSLHKVAQVTVMSYVKGYVEGSAAACDRGSRDRFCGRLRERRIDVTPTLPDQVARTFDRLCRARPSMTLRAIATHILGDSRLGLAARPAGRKMEER